MGIFKSIFAHLLYVPFYTSLQIFIIFNFDEVTPY